MRIVLLILVFVFTISAQDHLAEGARLAGLGDYEKALLSYNAAQNDAKDPEATARIHYNIGVCLYRLDRPADAVIELTKALDLKGGKYQRAWYALGMAETALDHAAEAKNAFTKAVELDKKDGEAWFDLALILVRENDLPAARVGFESAIKFGSINSADAHNNIGVIHALNGDMPEAIREFEISGSTEAIANLKYCREQIGSLATRVGSPRVSKGASTPISATKVSY